MWPEAEDGSISAARAWTASIRTMYWRGEPAGMVHNLLVHHAAELDAAVGDAPSSAVMAGLLRAEAEALAVAGTVAYFDMGRYGAAHRELKNAMRCARHSDDMRMCGWIFAKQSHLAWCQHNKDDAILTANAALEYTQANPLASADVFTRRAVAHAMDGNEAAALRDIDNAAEAASDATPADTPDWLIGFDSARVAGLAGLVRLTLGQPQEAVTELRRALTVDVAGNHAAVLSADLATGLGRIGEPDEGARTLFPVLPVAATSHSVERRARLQTAWRTLQPANTPATRALRDQLRTYRLIAA